MIHFASFFGKIAIRSFSVEKRRTFGRHSGRWQLYFSAVRRCNQTCCSRPRRSKGRFICRYSRKETSRLDVPSFSTNTLLLTFRWRRVGLANCQLTMDSNRFPDLYKVESFDLEIEIFFVVTETNVNKLELLGSENISKTRRDTTAFVKMGHFSSKEIIIPYDFERRINRTFQIEE